MPKILTIVGARPQFIKAAAVSHAIADHNAQNPDTTIHEELLHTGQHFDPNMSQVFFEQLEIPPPSVNLEVSGGTHGEMTAAMLAGIEKELLERTPDIVLVYGDTNSTLAGALAASKLHIPIAHVEAGLRSFNRKMPEEVNRVLTDHLSRWLFCPTQEAVRNLANEGITAGVHAIGDVMYDVALRFREKAAAEGTALSRHGLRKQQYYFATVHRAENTDDPKRLQGIFDALRALATADCPLILSIHPRTYQRLGLDSEKKEEIHELSPNLFAIPPVSFLDMVQLEANAKTILTDSGGVQKEAYFQGVPCVTLRDETEWVETVTAGWNQLAGADSSKILAAVHRSQPKHPIEEYGDGNAANLIIPFLVSAR